MLWPPMAEFRAVVGSDVPSLSRLRFLDGKSVQETGKKNEAGMFEKLVLGAVSAIAGLGVVLSMVEIVSVLLS